MAELYVKAFLFDSNYYFDVETLVTVYLYNLSNPREIQLKIKLLSEKISDNVVAFKNFRTTFEIIKDVPEAVTICSWPVILKENYVISGLCSVARQIVKNSRHENVKQLLGFREACLVSCAEVSVWTKFCEIDVICAVKKVLNSGLTVFSKAEETFSDSKEILDTDETIARNKVYFPEQVAQFEVHLSRPVKIHNIYKLARDKQNNQSLQDSKDRKGVDINHDFAEGPHILLSDLILYPCFQIIFTYFKKAFPNCCVQSAIPLINRWMKKMVNSGFSELEFIFLSPQNICDNVYKSELPKVDNLSLYRADNTKATNEKHTKQYKIDDGISILGNVMDLIKNDFLPYGYDTNLDWDTIPLDLNPKGGSLPSSRADRKCEQLENLAKAVVKLAGRSVCKIVDFCSGSGHLGLLVAYLLPNSKVVLVENKEMSLARAQKTIVKLDLKNVLIVQTNLDYFTGNFDIGVALHACGVATDLVLQMCIKNKADFVCCPCCYGGIKDCHEVNYPRSSLYQMQFKKQKIKYFDLAHAADQTHDVDNVKTKQGYLCMDIIDTDRKLFAEEFGYKVYLGKLLPTNCTNKNNLLVGILS